MRKSAMSFIILSVYLLFSLNLFAQLVSGPMLGQVELRTAKIWAEVNPASKAVSLKYWKKGEASKAKTIIIMPEQKAWYAPVLFNLVALEMNTDYEYTITVEANTKTTTAVAGFKTMELWQWRKPAPDFVFLTGSCAYFNEPVYDRPGKPYGGDSSIFETMAKEKASFMMWLGDNWYTREADYFSVWGLYYRASHDRALPIMKNFLRNMSHYAIWDDHDYGFNDADKSFIFRNESTEVFRKYWANPSYGQDGQGIYTKVSYSDCDFFLMDDRSFRTSDKMEPRIDGKPNPDKKMWGDTQMEWLKNSLRTSTSVFKIIVTGSQTLNAASPWDCLQNYPIEFNNLMNFLTEEKINGVLFITGDRHHSEINKWDRSGTYSLYDITSSALTSSVGKVTGNEVNNPGRLPNTLVEQNNYARITVSGAQRARNLKVEFVGVKGDLLASWSVKESELRTP